VIRGTSVSHVSTCVPHDGWSTVCDRRVSMMRAMCVSIVVETTMRGRRWTENHEGASASSLGAHAHHSRPPTIGVIVRCACVRVVAYRSSRGVVVDCIASASPRIESRRVPPDRRVDARSFARPFVVDFFVDFCATFRSHSFGATCATDHVTDHARTTPDHTTTTTHEVHTQSDGTNACSRLCGEVTFIDGRQSRQFGRHHA
jgi:hypothetical protein